MCGIIGLVGYPRLEAKEMAQKALTAIKYRGIDATITAEFKEGIFGHNLHSIIGYVEQPIESDSGIISSNCEIYNWEELASKHSIKARNDSELVLKLIEQKGEDGIQNVIEWLDGDFAIAYYSKKQKKLFLARDLAGVKPLAYYFDSKNKRIAFASEKKALNAAGINCSVHLNPRKILVFDANKGNVSFISIKIPRQKLKNPLIGIENLLISSVVKRLSPKKSGILFSGGLDSALLAKIIKEKSKVSAVMPEAYISGIVDEKGGLKEPKDFIGAVNAAKEIGLTLHIVKTTLLEFENELPKIIGLIESTDPVRVGVASTIYFAVREMKNNKVKIAFSGIGADELFAGYHRFKNSNDINKDCYSYFIKLYENDLYFEDIVCMKNNIELRVPFLDKVLVANSLNLAPKYKISLKTGENKIILRKIANGIGLSKEISQKEKKAAQYGSNFDKAIEILAKNNNFKSKTDYLQCLILSDGKNADMAAKNIPIAALISTGKDSLFAMHLMQKQGYEIKCLITIESKNKDSFMFHTPTIELSKLQAKSLNIPLIIVKTEGEKEGELLDLKKAIFKAISKYGIEGVCSGALYSNYQRERIEGICEALGIRSFAPLWHMNQISYLKALVSAGFAAIITKIAAQGLNERWLGRQIDSKAITELVALEKKLGINPAGEGGEYETLVIDAPIFEKSISIEFVKMMLNEFTGEVEIKKAELTKK